MAAWAVNDRLWARDRCYTWWEAVVVDEDGMDGARKLRIHFKGWNAREDEYIKATSQRLRAEPPVTDESEPSESEESELEGAGDLDGHVRGRQYKVDKLIAKKVVRGETYYKTRFEGYTSKYDEWLHNAHISDDLIDAFEASRARARPARQPKVAFSLSAGNEHLEHRTFTQSLARPWLNKLFRRSAKLLSKTKQPCPRRKLLAGQVCPPWLFVAIRDVLCEEATHCGGVVEEHLTAIKPLKGQSGKGDLVQDTFTVKTSDLIKSLLKPFRIGEGAGSMVYLKNKTSVGLLPPMKFVLTTRRSTPDAAELAVTAYMGTLVNAAGAHYEPYFKFGNCVASQATRVAWEISLSADLLAYVASGARVPPRLARWVHDRMNEYAAAGF